MALNELSDEALQARELYKRFTGRYPRPEGLLSTLIELGENVGECLECGTAFRALPREFHESRASGAVVECPHCGFPQVFEPDGDEGLEQRVQRLHAELAQVYRELEAFWAEGALDVVVAPVRRV